MTNNYSIKVTPTVYDVDGNVKKVYPTLPNLILDNGLDQIVGRGPMTCMNYFHIGTGTKTVNRKSGAGTISRSGNTVTSTVGFFNPDDANRVIQFSDNTSCRIETYNSPVSVDVATSGVLTNVSCIVWHTETPELETWYKSSNTPDITDSENNGTTIAVVNAGVLDQEYVESTTFLSRKFIINDDITVTEAGWSWRSTQDTSADIDRGMFGRIEFETPIDLLVNETLALKVTMIRVLFQHGALSADPIFGVPCVLSGEYLTPNYESCWQYVKPDGTIGTTATKLYLAECASIGSYDRFRFYKDDETYVDVNVTPKPYINGSRTQEMNTTEITTLGDATYTRYQIYSSTSYRDALVYTFNTPLVIPQDALLNLTYTITLDRVLPDFV